MNLENLILQLEQLKNISELVAQPAKNDSMLTRYLDKYVICRSRNAGIIFGKVIDIDSTGVVLSDARRMWYHKPEKGAWYESVAKYGIDKSSKVSTATEEKAIVEDYELTLVSQKALPSILNLEAYKE